MSLLFRIIRGIIPNSIIQKLKFKYRVPDMEWSLNNLKMNGFNPKYIVDIGAFQGEWTSMIQHIFIDSKVLMVEAQESKREYLNKLKSNKVDFEITLLGPEVNPSSKFYVNETVSSALPETEKSSQSYVEIPMNTLDSILQKRVWGMPDFIKLDVQGFELEVLKGAKESLKHAEVVLMEVSLLEINKGAPLIKDVINFMDDHSFVCYDICSIVRRPLDNALWQTDLIFVKKNSRLIASKKYEN